MCMDIFQQQYRRKKKKQRKLQDVHEKQEFQFLPKK